MHPTPWPQTAATWLNQKRHRWTVPLVQCWSQQLVLHWRVAVILCWVLHWEIPLEMSVRDNHICGITVQQLADLDEWFKGGKLVSITGWPTSPFFSFMNDGIPFGSCGRCVLVSCRSSSLIFWNMRLRYTFFITPLLNMWANSLLSPLREDSDLIPQAKSHDKTSPRGSRQDSLWNRTAVSLDPIYSHSVEKCFCGNDGCHYIVELCRWWCLSVYRTVCPLHTGGKHTCQVLCSLVHFLAIDQAIYMHTQSIHFTSASFKCQWLGTFDLYWFC